MFQVLTNVDIKWTKWRIVTVNCDNLCHLLTRDNWYSLWETRLNCDDSRVIECPWNLGKMSAKSFTPALKMWIEYLRCQIQWQFDLILAFFFLLKFFELNSHVRFNVQIHSFATDHIRFQYRPCSTRPVRGSPTFKNVHRWPICRRVHSRLGTFCIFLTYFGLK